MTWNYRLVRVKHPPVHGLEEVETYAIYEVYYSSNGVIEGRTIDPSYPMGEDLEEFQLDMNAYIRATVLPVLEEIDGKLAEIKINE